MSFESLGRILIVIPTYDEVDNIAWVVGRLRAAVPEVDVLIVDDSSPDGTGAVADRLAADDDQVRVLHRQGKEGLGAAYLAGFAEALQSGYDVIGEMDADGSHQPEELPQLLEALGEADLVIGSRWIPGGSIVNWSRGREALSRGGNLYVRALLGIDVYDATSGFRVFRSRTLEKIDLGTVRSAGYVFQTDLVARTLDAGLAVREVPIEFVERVRGESKMSAPVAVESLRRITGWGLRHRVVPAPAGRASAPGEDAMTRPTTRRRWVRLALFAAFIGVPLIEIWVLIQVGQVIGPWWTILLLILDSLFGTWLVRREGGRAWQGLRVALESGRMPARELADGALILVGGTLMLTPGFVTDAFGILLILPFTRPFARRLLTQVVTRRLLAGR